MDLSPGGDLLESRTQYLIIHGFTFQQTPPSYYTQNPPNLGVTPIDARLEFVAMTRSPSRGVVQ